MLYQPSAPIKPALTGWLKSIQVLSIALFIIGLGLGLFPYSTAKSAPKPIEPVYTTTKPVSTTSSVVANPAVPRLANPLATTFINARPSSDGREVFISAFGVYGAESEVNLKLEAGFGPSGHDDSYTMDLSKTTYIATALGFAPQTDIGRDGDDTMEITTMIAGQLVSTGDVDFQRPYVETGVAQELVVVDNTLFEVNILNRNTFSNNLYLLIMSSNSPPIDPLPTGYQFVSEAYLLNASGDITRSERYMTLYLGFIPPLPQQLDPHTLSMARWDAFTQQWQVLVESDYYDRENKLELITKQLGVYALVATPTWRDSFYTLALTGVDNLDGTRWVYAEEIELNSNTTEGHVTSIPITPTQGARYWDTVWLTATTSVTTGIQLDILDIAGEPVITDVQSGLDLSHLAVISYPALRLQATLTTTTQTVSPVLRGWSLSWQTPVERIYLPLVMK